MFPTRKKIPKRSHSFPERRQSTSQRISGGGRQALFPDNKSAGERAAVNHTAHRPGTSRSARSARRGGRFSSYAGPKELHSMKRSFFRGSLLVRLAALAVVGVV